MATEASNFSTSPSSTPTQSTVATSDMLTTVLDQTVSTTTGEANHGKSTSVQDHVRSFHS